MNPHNFLTIDANEAVARVAYALNEVIAIYPITPASSMGEWADAWAAEGLKNIWGTTPSVIEMQSEGGAAGAVHGALQTGSLATTFTASQGLLLMIPNMLKIAGELTPAVIHVAARALATHALSIFGDHSDVMLARPAGWAMLCSNNVQEAQDLALIAQAATFEAQLPFLHFFDGFRTSHEISTIQGVSDETIRAMVNEKEIADFRARALSPMNPVIRGTAQNPDVFFQGREASNSVYNSCANVVQGAMDKFAALTGRQYKLYEYEGAPDAERVILLMGSACETAAETAAYLNSRDEKVGVLKVRLFQPFDGEKLVEALPRTTRALAVLDRCKEAGAAGEPLYLSVVAALREFHPSLPVVGGRYGLSSKEFTPAMAKAVFDNLSETHPRNHFTVGINDDVTHTSLDYDPSFEIESNDTFRALFYGLGSDGTVGANKESIKIIGENTENFAQGYFVYDSKKSGAETVSHLRFGPRPIRAPYLIGEAHFIGVHQPFFIERFNIAEKVHEGGVVVLNTPHKPTKIWERLSHQTRRSLGEKKARLFVIDANKVARECGMAGRVNTIMQACFFSVSGVLPHDEALAAIKNSIRKAYGKKGEEVVRKNIEAVDRAEAHLFLIEPPADVVTHETPPHRAINDAPPFVRDVLGKIFSGRGEELPVSALPRDGTFPTSTARWEKRNLAAEIPVWEADACIQCGKCVFVCPHAAIRSKVYEADALAEAPGDFKSREARLPEWKGLQYTLQVAPEDCTGCGICVDVCPAKSKADTKLKAINMRPQAPLRENERANWDFFLKLPDLERKGASTASVRGMQTLRPLFEFSGACAGCGETPYLKLLTQLFGDRLLIANATGCSSIYGGNLPTTPWCKDAKGHGPAWCNSLFEDNAEFGYGFRVSLDKKREFAAELLQRLAPKFGDGLAARILVNEQRDEADIAEQRELVAALKNKLAHMDDDESRRLLTLADSLVRQSVWIVGGDGWAYDIGYGGLDHVLASGRNVKVLVLDTEVYSNTGGQASKSTPRGAVAKFSMGGKPAAKKDLGLIAMTYGNIYVASVAMGAKDEHTLKTFMEAEAYDGPALIIAYSHCIAHGIDMGKGLQNQKAAVNSGRWLLYRFNPERAKVGENPLQLDSPAPRQAVAEYLNMENRFRVLTKSKPEDALKYYAQAEVDVQTRWALYQYMASRKPAAPAVANTVTCNTGADQAPAVEVKLRTQG